MLRKHASLVIAMSLIALVTTACIIRTRRPPPGQPVMVEERKEKHKEQKHKDPHDNGHGRDDDHDHGHGHGHD